MRISDRALRRWLRTGRPRRIEHHLDDPDVAARLEQMTALDAADVAALREMTDPVPGIEDRVGDALRERVGRETSGVFLDLLGLGWRTAATLLDAAPVSPETPPGPTPAGDGDDGSGGEDPGPGGGGAPSPQAP